MSVSAATLRLLMDAGLYGEALLAVVESIDSDNAKAGPSAGAIRAKRYRDRKAENVTKGVTRHVTEAKDVSPTPPSENNSPLPKGPLKGPQKVSPPSSEKPKSETAKPLSWWVAELWSITPAPGRRRSGKRSLETALGAAIRRGDEPAAIKAGLEAYYASPDATERDGKFAQGVHVAVSTGRWAAFSEIDTSPDPPEIDPWPRRLLGWRTNAYWNSEWGPKPGKPGYEGPEIESQAA